jgi:hypothetical protein
VPSQATPVKPADAQTLREQQGEGLALVDSESPQGAKQGTQEVLLWLVLAH